MHPVDYLAKKTCGFDFFSIKAEWQIDYWEAVKINFFGLFYRISMSFLCLSHNSVYLLYSVLAWTLVK